LLAEILKRPENKGATIVLRPASSHVVPDTIKAAGGVPKRDRVGHAFIKKTMAETKAVFGGELSGHFYFQGNFYAIRARSRSRRCSRSCQAERAGEQATGAAEQVLQSGEIKLPRRGQGREDQGDRRDV
jgi:hypothetical protein